MKNKVILATGADIKNRFLLAKGRDLYNGPDISDLSNADNYRLFKKEVKKATRSARADKVVCDLHPGYFSSSFAKEYSELGTRCSLLPVQHHHAHIASVMHEYELNGPVIGVSFDGTGYGTDGNIWGGEFLVVDRKGFKRSGYLQYRKMPGGDKVVTEPWRMVLSILGEKGAAVLKNVPKKEKDLVLTMISRDINSPLTSSAGRLFDASAALLGICEYASYEAEGPIKLEAMCEEGVEDGYDFEISNDNGCFVIDAQGLFHGMLRDIRAGKSKEVIASRFHNSMSKIIVKTAGKISKQSGIMDVALSGGVFQNQFLKTKVLKGLIGSKYKTFINRSVPASDLNIAMGQYYVSSSSGKG